MSNAMIATIMFLILLFGIITLIKRSPVMFDDEEETTTVTTTTEDQPHLNIVGNLRRQPDGVQSFVVDPVDQQKIWLNSNDDLYEDAAGKVWRLVG